MKYFFTHILAALVLVVFSAPLFLSAAPSGDEVSPGGLIVCEGTPIDPCTYSSLVGLLMRSINALVKYSTLLAVVVFIIAGFKLMTSGGSEGARKEAKKMFTAVLTGYIIILVAWLLVYTILKVLINPNEFGDYSLLESPR